MKIQKIFQKFFSVRNFPLILLLVIFFGYGYQFWRMGIYWDDWQAILLSQIDVPHVFWNYYLFDRPFSIWTYLLPLPLAQNYPAVWQVLGILARWFAAIGFWFFLRGMFPNRRQEAAYITLLWSFYPGFFTQSVSIAFIQHFITYGFFNFSLTAMVWAERKPKQYRVLTVLAVVSSLISLLTMEYFAGLELLRPVIFWLNVDKANKSYREIVRCVIKKWLPYLAIIVLFLMYRFIILDQLNDNLSGNDPELLFSFLAQPLQAGIRYLQIMVQDVMYLIWQAWGTTISPQSISFTNLTFITSIALGALASALLFMIVSKWNYGIGKTQDTFLKNGVILAVVAILLGGIPIWSMERQVIVGLWSNRFALAPMFGVSILTVVFWRWIARNTHSGNLILATLLALSIAYQVRVVNQYQNNWLEQERFYWQMLWRAPSIEPGIAILSPTMPFGRVSEYSIAFAMNVIYGDRLNSEQLPYYYFSALRYRFGEAFAFEKDFPIQGGLRSLSFEGSTSQAVVFYEAPYQRCIWFVEEDDAFLTGINQETKELFAISDLTLISPRASYNLKAVQQIFGKEIEHNWCYYYQKAELAAQNEDWQGVVNLLDQANNVKEQPQHGRELFPFISAFAHSGDWQKVEDYSQSAIELTEDISARICRLWIRLEEETPTSSEKDVILSTLASRYACDL